MICFLRTSASSYDIRLRKYLDACAFSNTPQLAITWDRLLDRRPYSDREFSFEQRAEYGLENRTKKFFQFLLWNLFAVKNLFIHRKEYHVIHACNIETAFVAYFFKCLFGKKMIFDIYDTSNKFMLERFFAKHSDLLILPHELRAVQIGLKENEPNLFVVENVPHFDGFISKEHLFFANNKIHIAYVGIMQRKIRGLENLIAFALKHENVELEVAGLGDGMEIDFKNASKECSRIKYLGAVNYKEALDIMSRNDFIFACYYLNARTHKYASPNKFYESLFLARPIITTKNTLIGDRVESENTGYSIGENLKDIEDIFVDFNKESFILDYERKVRCCQNMWQIEYSNYFETHTVQDYINRCKSL